MTLEAIAVCPGTGGEPLRSMTGLGESVHDVVLDVLIRRGEVRVQAGLGWHLAVTDRGRTMTVE